MARFFRSFFSPSEQEGRVYDDKNRTGVMYKSAYNRIQDAGNCQDNCGKIQCHGKCQIQPDCGHHSFGKTQKMRQFFYIIIDQSNIRGIHSDVASDFTHCNAHIGFFQRRRVIDAVSDHADRLPVLLICIDPGEFIFRKTSGMDLTDMEKSGDMNSGIFYGG